MKKLCLLLLIISSLTSCSYEMEIELPEFTPRIILNSFISPASEVCIDFTWSRKANEEGIENVTLPHGSATLYEDEVLVAQADIRTKDTNDKTSLAKFNFTPREGHTYKVVATIVNYGEVSAQTYIPKSCTLATEVVKQEEIDDFNYLSTAGIESRISDIELHDELRSLWFYTYGRTITPNSQEISVKQTNYGIIFCDNPYIDNITRAEEVDLTGESLYLEYRTGDPMYHQCLRLAQADIAKRREFSIASEYVCDYAYSDYDENTPYLTHVRLVTVSPSDDFDRYQKNAYQQAEGIYYFDCTPISFKQVRVYTNVKNGLGIFAGYSQTISDLPVKNFSEEE